MVPSKHKINLLFFREYVNETLDQAGSREALGIATLIFVLALSPIIIVLVRNAVATIQVPRSCACMCRDFILFLLFYLNF